PTTIKGTLNFTNQGLGTLNTNTVIVGSGGSINGLGCTPTLTIASLAGSGLNISGGGTVTATGGINLTATASNLEFSGNLTFIGPTTLNASSAGSSKVLVDNTVTLTGSGSTSTLTVNSPTFSVGGANGGAVNVQSLTGNFSTFTNTGTITTVQGFSDTAG